MRTTIFASTQSQIQTSICQALTCFKRCATITYRYRGNSETSWSPKRPHHSGKCSFGHDFQSIWVNDGVGWAHPQNYLRKSLTWVERLLPLVSWESVSDRGYQWVIYIPHGGNELVEVRTGKPLGPVEWHPISSSPKALHCTWVPANTFLNKSCLRGWLDGAMNRAVTSSGCVFPLNKGSRAESRITELDWNSLEVLHPLP